MTLFDKLKNPALMELVKDQRLKEVLTRREFRITAEYLHREFLSRAEDDEIQELKLIFGDGFGEISGKVKKRLLPMAIPFSLRFSVEKVAYSSWEKKVYLKVEQVKPFDLDWVTGKVVAQVPFLSFNDGIIACDLEKIPRLEEMLAYQVKGIRLADFLAIKELAMKDGELVGRLGFCL